MARIKYVINERRLAYEGAVQIHEERRLAALAERKARNEAIAEATAEKATKEAQADAKAVEGLQGAKAARLAAAALFDAAPVSQGRGLEGEKKA